MKTDRIFVLLLVVMLPMSGCFDDGVGDAEAAEDSTGTTVNHYNNTTVVNHHYHNNTTTVLQQTPDKISIGGLIGNVTSTGISMPYYVTMINSSAGELIQLHEAYAQQVYNHSVLNRWYTDSTMEFRVQSSCISSSGEIKFVISSGSGGLDEEEYLPGSAFDCSHEVAIIDGSGDDHLGDISWSLTYSILPTTVADAN